MSAPKHTPGPWKEWGFSDYWTIVSSANKTIGRTEGLGDLTEDAANARLWAAAPDLLKAVKRLLAVTRDYEEENATLKEPQAVSRAMKAAEAAVASAEGRTDA